MGDHDKNIMIGGFAIIVLCVMLLLGFMCYRFDNLEKQIGTRHSFATME